MENYLQQITILYNKKTELKKTKLEKNPIPNQIHFELREYQKECVNKVIENWNRKLPAIISSQTGSGKTYMAVKAATIWKANKVIVIGPKSSLTKWRQVLLDVLPYNKIEVYTYEKWRMCGILYDNIQYTEKKHEGENVKIINYYPTIHWNKLITNERVVFILDEFHKLQKLSQRTMSISANVNAIVLGNNNSRVLSLSYTPCDNITNIPNNMYLFGIIQTKKLLEYDRVNNIYNTDGLENVIKYAEKISGQTLRIERLKCSQLSCSSGKSVQRDSNRLAGEIFLDYIRPHMVYSCVPDFLKDPLLIPYYTNYFCRVTKKTEREISAILDFQIRKENIQNDFEYKNEKSNMTILTHIQSSIEKLKTDIYIQIARDILINIPNSKVPIMILYLNSLDRIMDELKEFNPVKICGEMNVQQRNNSINKFQEHNLDCRVLVATLQTGGESIDLHDTSINGKFPRYILIPPTYSTKPMVQATGRVFRDGVTSKPTIKIIYTTSMNALDNIENDYNIEYKFYDTVRNKTNTIKKYHAEGQESVLPCNYASIVSEKIYKTLLDTQPENFGFK